MPSAFSVKYRLELPAFGEKSNLWGPVVNSNVGVLLEQAIDGYAAIAMPDANLTLSTVNAADDQARNKMFRFSGTLTTPREVIVPSTSRSLMMWNATSQSLTYKTAGGAGVTFPANSRAWVFCDGADVFELTNYARLAGGSIAGMASVSAAEVSRGVNNLADYSQRVITSSYILTDADRHRSIYRTGAAECFLLLPLNATTPFPLGTVILVTTDPAAAVTNVGPLTGAVLRQANSGAVGTVVLPGGSAAWLIKVKTDEWYILDGVTDGSLRAANNLSDVASAATSRVNLGLGTSATATLGTTGATVPLLNGANTHADARGVAAAPTSDLQLGFRKLRPASVTAGVPAAADSDSCIYATGNIELPSAVFTKGDSVLIYNDTASGITVAQGSGLTLRRDGTPATGSRTLAARGRAAVLYVSATEAVIGGAIT